MIHRTDHLFSKGKMVIKLKHTKRFGLSLLFVFLLAGCAATPPRTPTIEPVDRDAIKAALKRVKTSEIGMKVRFSDQVFTWSAPWSS